MKVEQGLETDCADRLERRFKAEPDPTATEIVEVRVSGEGEARVDLDVSQAGGGPSRVVLGLIEKDGGWRIALIR